MDKVDKPSVCFFMLYYKRPELTRMSMWHMAKTLKRFREAGHECEGIVIGSDRKQQEYAESLGLEHIHQSNDPLARKFLRAFKEAIAKEKDYVCKVDSNNVHSDDFWDKCIEHLKEPRKTFGTQNFTIVDSRDRTKEGVVWVANSYQTCNSGQFYNTKFLKLSAHGFHIKFFPSHMTRKFDALVNRAMRNKYRSCFSYVDRHFLDCIDVKSDTDIHKYDSYAKHRRLERIKPEEIFDHFEELKLLQDGYFKYP